MEMTKILLTNTNCSVNKGSAAQVISTCKTLREIIPDLEITLMSRIPELDTKLCKIHNINVVRNRWFPRRTGWQPLYYTYTHILIDMFLAGLFKIGLNPRSINNPIVQEYISADAIIDLSGDSFSDGKGGFSIGIDASILFGFSFKKPIVVYSQSIGPFNWAVTFLAKYCLNRVDLVIVREEITEKYLKELEIESSIYLTADCAFLLDSAPYDEVKDILSNEGIDVAKKPIVGVSANAMLDDKENNYANTMAQLIDYVIEKINAHVIFVPHVVSVKEGGKGDDRFIGEKIYKLAKNKNNIDLIKGDYSPEELKGIIGLCDVFIGGRMHANIAAISTCIPTIATAWSHKYYGISRSVGQEKYVCDYKNMTFDEMKLKFDDLWDNRNKIRDELKIKVDEQKKLAWYSAELVKDLLSR